MARNHLLLDSIDDLIEREPLLFLGQPGQEGDLEQHVAELGQQAVGILGVDRRGGLVSFLQQVRP